MPNLAFLSLIYLLLAVPGFLYRTLYFSGEFTRQSLSRNWTDDIAKGILYSLPFHIAWLIIFEILKHRGFLQYTVTVHTMLRLLSGEYPVTDDGQDHFADMVSTLYHNKGYIALYYGLVFATSIGCAYFARKYVWKNELDVKWTWLRYKNDWLYRIMGRGTIPGVAQQDTASWVDIVTNQETDMPGKLLMYRGRAAGFTTEEDGSLRNIILTNAMRSAFQKNGDKTSFAWHSIPGNSLVIDKEKIQNMNFTYLKHSDVEAALQSLLTTKGDEPLPEVAPIIQPSQASLDHQS